MANVDRPRGLVPVQHISGGSWNGKTNMYLMTGASGAAYIGDLVKLGGTAGTAGQTVNGIDVEGMPTIAQAAAGDGGIGVVVGFLPLQTNLETKYRVNSTDRIALVCDDPGVIYEIQEVSGGTALTADEVGLNANVVVGSGNTTTGLSGMELNNSGENTTADLDLRIMGLVKRPDNAIGEHAKWLVMISTHQLNNMAGITGA